MERFNLQRYIEAQNFSYKLALKEVKNGRKRNHWIWYVFPQIKGLGRSSTSEKYAIQSLEEAQAYLQNDTLRERLLEISESLLALENHSALDVFGSPDDLKVKSCMTLFELADSKIDCFGKVLDKYYQGGRCERTLKFLKEQNV